MSGDAATGNRRAPSLSPEQVARAALEMLDRDGLEGLSMRRLASELGVGTMTLYGYFRGKRELLDAVVDVAAQDFDPPVPSGDFEQDVIAHSLAARRWLMRHPTLVRLRGEEAIVRPSAFRISEGLMRLLLDHGLAPEHAAKAFRLLFTHLFGSVLFSPHDATPEEGRRLTAALLTLPEDEFPAMREAAPHAAGALGGEAQFRFELEVILGGLSR